jgi:acyl-CoA thioesterase-2
VSTQHVPSSLHAHFLRPATASLPLTYEVASPRDGRSYGIREVNVSHGESTLTSATLLWRHAGAEADAVAFVDADVDKELPPVPAPHPLPYPAPGVMTDDLDLRWLDTPAGRGLWFRPTRPLGLDRHLHSAVALYVSDLWLLDTLLGAVGLRFDDRSIRAGSLDHCAWFHRPIALDDWCYLESHAVSLVGGSGLVAAALHSADGQRLASFRQAVAVRRRSEQPAEGHEAR